MGYYASGYGFITCKELLSVETIDKIIDILSDEFEADAYTQWQNNSRHTGKAATEFTVTPISGSYHGEYVKATLKEVAEAMPIAAGEICFSGDDDCYWRFLWNGDSWLEQEGHIVYDDPDAFGQVTWTRADIEDYINEHAEFPEDNDFINEVLTKCQTNNHFTDGMTEAGWQAIADVCYEVLESRKGD